MKKLNLGVIGMGRMGMVYAHNIAYKISNANLVAVCARTEDKEKLASLDNPTFYNNYNDLIQDNNVEAVLVVTPAALHKDVSIAAAKAKKPIFCEKPLSLHLEDALELESALNETGTYFQFGFMRRFDKAYLAGKERIEQGEIGDIVMYKGTSRDPFRPHLEYLQPENSGGVFCDMGAHEFDIARWLVGDVKSVFSVGGILAHPEMEGIKNIDNGIVNMYFENGAIGSADFSLNAVYGYDIRAEVLGTKGSIHIGYLKETPITIMNKQGVIHDTVPHFPERFDAAFLSQIQDFVHNVIHGKSPKVTCGDGIAAQKIGEAATESYFTKKLVDVAP